MALGDVKAEMIGDKKTRAELRRMQRKWPEALAVALFEEGVEIFKESQEQVPVDTGRLKGSGLVFMRRAGTDFSTVIGYGTAYALRIHEDTSLDAGRQNRAELALSNPGFKSQGSQVGKSKYLSDPFEEALPGMARRLATRTRRRAMTAGLSLAGVRTVRGRRQ